MSVTPWLALPALAFAAAIGREAGILSGALAAWISGRRRYDTNKQQNNVKEKSPGPARRARLRAFFVRRGGRQRGKRLLFEIEKQELSSYNRTRLKRKQVQGLHEPVAVYHEATVFCPVPQTGDKSLRLLS